MRSIRPAQFNIGIDLNSDVLQDTSKLFDTMDPIVITDDGIHALLEDRHNWRCGPTPSEITMITGLHLETITPSEIAVLASIASYDDGSCRYRFLNCDSVEFLGAYPFTGDEFIYSDPPYLMETRSSKRAIYEYEYTTSDHVVLLDVLRSIPCKVMISGYPSSLYDQMLAGWHKYTFDAVTRSGKMATEVLWMNYPEPNQLHDYQYLGEDFRERERIKRKKNRWVARLEQLDPLERKAILWAIRDSGLIEDPIVTNDDSTRTPRHKRRSF